MSAPQRRHGKQAPVSPARVVAYDVLRAVDESDSYANLLLPTYLERRGVSGLDAAFATELTYGTLRRRGYYDAVIESAAGRSIDRIDPEVRDALRLGAHQLLATRVRPHAAVNESVELVRAHGGRGAAGFANAVLRAISRSTPAEWNERVAESVTDETERLALLSAHPAWIVRALRSALGAEGRGEELPALLESDNIAPGVTLAALPGLAEVPADAVRTVGSPIGFRAPAGDPTLTVDQAGGRIRVQDEGSQLAALALTRARPIAPGERWLDLCAGPGGKTAILAAEALTSGAHLEANEVVPARAGLVRRSIAGVPLRITVTEEDGRSRVDRDEGVFDRVLIDAPCTGLGALRRRPEARWRKSAADLTDLTRLQRELLDAGVRALRAGGLLAYVTCSPHRAETTAVVEDAASRWGERLKPLDTRRVIQSIVREGLDLAEPPDGALHAQLWPHRHGTDAMFIALFERTGAHTG